MAQCTVQWDQTFGSVRPSGSCSSCSFEFFLSLNSPAASIGLSSIGPLPVSASHKLITVAGLEFSWVAQEKNNLKPSNKDATRLEAIASRLGSYKGSREEQPKT